LHEAVIPGSLKKFDYKDKDGYCVYRMMLFVGPPKKQNVDVDPNAKKEKTVVEQVHHVARELKVTLREHTHNPVESEKKKQTAAMLEAETSAAVVRMKQNC
jgi:hypothetical protein